MFMKKTIYGCLLCLLGLMTASVCFAQTSAPADFTGHTWYEYKEPITEGTGTMTDPILISSAGQLAQLAYNVNTGADSYEKKIVALAADIDLNKVVDGQRVQWIPIGYNPIYPFSGMFLGLNLKDYAENGYVEGQKHKISGLYINVTTANDARQFGLFGFLDGNVSHLQLEDVSISVDLSSLSASEYYFVGALCGSTVTNPDNTQSVYVYDAWYQGIYEENAGDQYPHKLPHGIDDVAVSGTLSAKGNENAVVSVGGICGRFDISCIIHSTANVVINASDCMFIGGICGVDNGIYYKNANSDTGRISKYGKCLYDCISNATITCNGNVSRSVMVGGIVGQMEEGEKAYACVSMGSIRCTNADVSYNVGGICGYMQPYSGIFASGSTMMIKAQGYIGGIAGKMKSGTDTSFSKYGKIECCSFSGHLDGSNKIIDEKGQTTGVASSAPADNYIGGICGHLEWNDNLEHITRCLLLGTITTENFVTTAPMPSAIVGKQGTATTALTGDNLASTVTYCYYDNMLFSGNAVPGSMDGGNSAKGLTTFDLTSANESKLTWLNAGATETGDYGYRLEKGYYPIFYENNGVEATYYTNYYRAGWSSSPNSTNNEHLSKMFDFYSTNTEANFNSTVYVSGAMLCAMPVSFVKGDNADDFVSTLSAPTKTYNWDEKLTGRSIIMTVETFFPESDVIRVKDKTATANNNGTCFVTTTGTVRKKSVTYNRPAFISGTKHLGLNSTIDSEWRGNEATGFAAGTGTASDPYLIKNAAQLYHAIKTNQTGQFYKQICNITIAKSENVNHEIENTLITKDRFSNRLNPNRHFTDSYWQTDNCSWNANYNGDGHMVSGLYLYDYYDTAPTMSFERKYFSLFGDVEQYGSVNNLAVVDTWIAPEPWVKDGTHTYAQLQTYYGIIANFVKGSISNCIVQGVNAVGTLCGGICTYVMPGGTVEDCISAVTPFTTNLDYFTPFVAYDPTHTDAGTVKNCLAVSPTMFSSADKSVGTLSGVTDCYWLKGYEPGNTGQTLDEIGAALGKRDRWTWTRNYFPTLKTFANTDIAKLMMVPVRTDNNYEFNTSTSTANNYLMGFQKMLEFEPGAATWTNLHGTDYFEADSELGIVAPANAMGAISTSDVMINPMEVICASLGKSFYYIPLRTNSEDIERGISFVDDHARKACVKAFDTNSDGKLSLAEISAVTSDQTLTAFMTDNVQLEALQIVKFPEFRFFKAVTNLTTQLSGLSKLEEVRLPYNLQTISGDPSLTGNGTRPFSMTSIKSITLPAKVTTIEPGAFYSEFSEIENIFVDPFNTHFESREGILFDNNNALVAYPNGRTDTEIVIPGVIEEIKPGAIYDPAGYINKIFFDTTDYTTVADLNENGIFTGDGSLVDVYISDATYGSILYNEYLEDDSWTAYANAGKLHCYYPLKIGSAKAATMYIGFDTELPEALSAYIVTSSDADAKKAYLRKMSNEIPNRSPIVIFAEETDTYRLYPLDEKLDQWNMYENQLNGVGRDGMEVYQSDADRGSILTLGRNSDGELGFFYYMGTAPIAPYRAYMTYEWVGEARQYLLFSFLDGEGSETESIDDLGVSDSRFAEGAWYSLDGKRLGREKPSAHGIYIHNGRLEVINSK